MLKNACIMTQPFTRRKKKAGCVKPAFSQNMPSESTA